MLGYDNSFTFLVVFIFLPCLPFPCALVLFSPFFHCTAPHGLSSLSPHCQEAAAVTMVTQGEKALRQGKQKPPAAEYPPTERTLVVVFVTSDVWLHAYYRVETVPVSLPTLPTC